MPQNAGQEPPAPTARPTSRTVVSPTSGMNDHYPDRRPYQRPSAPRCGGIEGVIWYVRLLRPPAGWVPWRIEEPAVIGVQTSGVRWDDSRRTGLLTRENETDRTETPMEADVIILGVILLVLGFVLSITILWAIGVILVVVGAVLWILGAIGRPVAGRKYWF